MTHVSAHISRHKSKKNIISNRFAYYYHYSTDNKLSEDTILLNTTIELHSKQSIVNKKLVETLFERSSQPKSKFQAVNKRPGLHQGVSKWFGNCILTASLILFDLERICCTPGIAQTIWGQATGHQDQPKPFGDSLSATRHCPNRLGTVYRSPGSAQTVWDILFGHQDQPKRNKN